MRLSLILSAFFVVTNLPLLQSYQTATKIIQDQLVDNNNEQISIRSQLTEEEALEIIQFLEEEGIPSKKKVSATDQVNRMSNQIWEVSVSPTNTVEAIILLDEAGLPSRRRSSIFEEFISRIREGYTMSEEQETLARELEDYIEKQPGIVNADVLIKWDKDPFQQDEVLKTLLYIRHTGTLDDPHAELATQLKRHVLNNVQNLEEEHIIFVTEREAPLNYQFPDYTK